MSEKSTRKAPDYAFKSRAARNRSVFRPELQLYRCHTAEERYNPSKSGLKKEIPESNRSGPKWLQVNFCRAAVYSDIAVDSRNDGRVFDWNGDVQVIRGFSPKEGVKSTP